MRARGVRVAFASALICWMASLSRSEVVDLFSIAYQRTDTAMGALGDASFSLRGGDRVAAILQIDYAEGAALEAIGILTGDSEGAKAPSRRLRALGRRFISTVGKARTSSLDGRVDDTRLGIRISQALRAGSALTKGLAYASDGVLLTAPTVDVTGMWSGSWGAGSWNAVFRQTGSDVFGTVSANGNYPYGTKTVRFRGWVSGNTVFLYSDLYASANLVTVQATITGTTLAGSFQQAQNALFDGDRVGGGSLTGAML